MTTKLKDLDDKQLLAAADAFAVEAEGGHDNLVAALVDAGVTGEAYDKMFGLKTEEDEKPRAKANAVTTEDMRTPTAEEFAALAAELALAKERLEEAQAGAVVVKEEYAELGGNQQWLVKMVRDNPLFEIAGHRFTKDHPYALLDAEKAEVVLREEGFRQARPSEIEEYYG